MPASKAPLIQVITIRVAIISYYPLASSASPDWFGTKGLHYRLRGHRHRPARPDPRRSRREDRRRRPPHSRKKGFSKEGLRSRLAESGVAYEHFLGLRSE